MKEAKAELVKIVTFTEEEHEKFIIDKKLKIVNFQLQNNTFYKQLVGEKGFESWEKLPILNKKSLQKPLLERLSIKYSIKKIYVNKTSNSSDDPFIFAKDKYCHALT